MAWRSLSATIAVLALALALPACAAESAASTDVSALAEVSAPPAAATPRAAALSARYFDPDLPADPFYRRLNPDPAKVDIAALDRLVAEAGESESDALVVAQDDVIIVEKYFGHRPGLASVQSVTKSVVSLAIGALIDEGKIPSVDVPVSTFFPEWSEGPKSSVTLRQLLTMTGGLADDQDLWKSDDYVAYARAKQLSFSPGSTYVYSNTSTMLFAGIVSTVTGMSIDAYVNRHYFAPLGITESWWSPDASGTPQTSGGLYLTPRGLLRLGTLGLNRGTFGERRLISESWITESTANQTPLEGCYGYLWWVVRPGCDGWHFGTVVPDGKVQGFFADGWGGNYVAVIPDSHVVAVRTKLPENPADELRTRYLAFTQNAAALAPHGP